MQTTQAIGPARCQHSGCTVALKIYMLDQVPENTLHMLAREIQIHASLVHPHIAALYGAFQDGKYLVMVQEWAARGDLHAIHRARGRPLGEEQLARVVLAPFLSALAYLHSRGICHRDIKPENILFTSDWELKLAAPEVSRCPIKTSAFQNKERLDLAYTYAADVWSSGILAYELLLGFPPFAEGGISAAAAAAAAGVAGRGPGADPDADDAAAAALPDHVLRLVLPPPLPRTLSAGARDFIRSALAADPAERPSAMQLLRHPWMLGLAGATARGEGAASQASAAVAAAGASQT
ncbi:hypothetical protein GPECTOR_2g1374 [Gonium pectorale]|uniref:Protein kinase domain-containing protein n=1 Tax=Gonium pectorale TaxID=33097 RepID=A0A150H1D9_GONPE|nr:hypothetical protein GPECTOR_2g1374 [Gonium pectorale]|eukprot:KXZ55823.1 hypothetical protein GPECTOR_2g1374 [Gonium pectorale]